MEGCCWGTEVMVARVHTGVVRLSVTCAWEQDAYLFKAAAGGESVNVRWKQARFWYVCVRVWRVGVACVDGGRKGDVYR